MHGLQDDLNAESGQDFQELADVREIEAAAGDTATPAQRGAFLAEDAQRIAAKGKIIVFQSIENSGILGNDVTLLRTFYKLGVRLAGPIHFLNNQLGDSATDKKQWGGLSPLGKEFVKEANDLGIVLDASHSSDDVFDQMMDLSRAPIICSHSGCRAVHHHPRNLDDARIKRLAAAGSTVSRENLVSDVLGRDFSPFDRSIDTHVCNLRRKLGPLEDGSERIKGVRGAGYLYASPARTRTSLLLRAE